MGLLEVLTNETVCPRSALVCLWRGFGFLHHVLMWKFAWLGVGFQRSLCLCSLFFFPLPSLHLSFLLLMRVHVHLPIWLCDSCRLFVYIVSGLHIYKANRFTMNPTLNASHHLSSSKFPSCFFTFWTRTFSHDKDCEESTRNVKWWLKTEFIWREGWMSGDRKWG